MVLDGDSVSARAFQDTLGAPIKHDWASAPSLVVHIKAPEALLLGTTRGATPSAVGQSSPRLNNSGLEKCACPDVHNPTTCNLSH